MLFKKRKRNQNKIKPPRRKRKITMTIVFALSLLFGKARLSPSQSPSSNFDNQEVHQRLIDDREFNVIEDNSRQVILAKAEGNPVTAPTNRGPSSFPTPPSGGRPSQPVYVPKYRVAPKLVDQGLGAAANPAGAGGGSGAAEFEDQCPASKKEKSETSNSNYDYRWSSKKKKKNVKIGTSVVAVKSDSNGNPIFSIEKTDGTKIVCTYEQALAKYYHADVHGLEFPKGFDQNRARQLAPADRKAYIASTVPKQNILEFLKANVASLSSNKLKPVPGFIGSRKESGTIYFNRNSKELHFVNEMTQIMHFYETL